MNGIPQGLRLGPLLFKFSINEIVRGCNVGYLSVFDFFVKSSGNVFGLIDLTLIILVRGQASGKQLTVLKTSL